MNGQYPESGPRTAVSKDKRKFTQLIYELCQLPTLILASDHSTVSDCQRQVKKLVAQILEESHVVTGPKTTARYDFDRLTAHIHQVRMETTVIGPYRIVVKILYSEVFDSLPKEVYLELHAPLYFKPLPPLQENS